MRLGCNNGANELIISKTKPRWLHSHASALHFFGYKNYKAAKNIGNGELESRQLIQKVGGAEHWYCMKGALLLAFGISGRDLCAMCARKAGFILFWHNRRISLQENAPPWDPTTGPCLGSQWGPRGVGVFSCPCTLKSSRFFQYSPQADTRTYPAGGICFLASAEATPSTAFVICKVTSAIVHGMVFPEVAWSEFPIVPALQGYFAREKKHPPP